MEMHTHTRDDSTGVKCNVKYERLKSCYSSVHMYYSLTDTMTSLHYYLDLYTHLGWYTYNVLAIVHTGLLQSTISHCT